MNIRHLIAIVFAALALTACGGKGGGSSSTSTSGTGTTGGASTSSSSTGGTGTTGSSSSSSSSSSSGSTGTPAQPSLGAQIDRMGRPAVNTALTDPFDTVAATLPDGGHKSTDQVKDEYNGASNPATWAGSFQSPIAVSLGILDALDGTCGNQLLAAPADGGAVPADRYAALAAVLVDDRLYVNTASGTCTTYLGVEANAVGIANTDCGGRTPLEDVIDESYSVLAAGALSGVTDGVSSDADGTASLTAFPFLAAPNP